ncbi:MAG: DUF2141 domain-containing protein [Cyclobacteriaceae bacterium]|nr:DUF2141 domain-containing protein [Cyclobacteriaceae bacterium]
MKGLICFFLFLIPARALTQSDSTSISVSNPGYRIIYHGTKLKPEETTYSITVVVTDIRNTNGTIRFKFYDDTTPFPHDTGFLKVVVDKSEVVNGTLTKTFYGFKSQNMAIALLDDENNDVKLEMGWFLPKEGHAFSDYFHAALRRPVYSDFKFFLKGDKKVIMKMKYY